MSDQKELPEIVKKKVRVDIFLSSIIDDFVVMDVEQEATKDQERGELYVLNSGVYKIIKHTDNSITVEGDIELIRYMDPE